MPIYAKPHQFTLNQGITALIGSNYL